MRLAVTRATRRVPGLVPRLKRLATRLGASLRTGDCTVSLLLTDDAGIQDLNVRFRQVHEPTDVLSFPSGTDGQGAAGHPLGDVAISLQRAEAQAEEHGHGVAEEAEVLLLHGVLHLLGHDHETDQGQMRRLESRLARELFGEDRGLIARAGED